MIDASVLASVALLSCGLLFLSSRDNGSGTMILLCLLAPGLSNSLLGWLGLFSFSQISIDLGVVVLLLGFWWTRSQRARRQALTTEESANTWGIVVLPATYLMTFGVFQLVTGSRGLSFLLNTWDGSSNSGLVRALEVNPNLTMSATSITQWENYPNFAHQFAALVSRLIQEILKDDPRTTLIVFAFVSSTLYAVLVLQVGRLAASIVLLKFHKPRAATATAIASQALFFSPSLINDFALMHSISFIAALIGTLIAIRSLLEVCSRRGLVTAGFAAILVSGSYPLLSLIPIIAWTVCALLDTRGISKKLLGAAALAPALVLTYSSLALNSTDGRLQATGHIQTLPSWLVGGTTIVVLSLAAAQAKSRPNVTIVGITLLIFGVCQFLWESSPSRSRDYGLNYYAKKFEYAALVILVPFLCALLARLVLKALSSRSDGEALLTRHHGVGKSPVILSFSLVAVLLVIASTMYTVVIPTERDRQAQVELEAAIEEARRPGPGIIWYTGVQAKPLTPTLMANYLDKSLWREPFLEDLNLRLFQAAQGNATDRVTQEMCEVSSRRDVKTRVTYLNPRQYEY